MVPVVKSFFLADQGYEASLLLWSDHTIEFGGCDVGGDWIIVNEDCIEMSFDMRGLNRTARLLPDEKVNGTIGVYRCNDPRCQEGEAVT